jgi:hypothetical protein
MPLLGDGVQVVHSQTTFRDAIAMVNPLCPSSVVSELVLRSVRYWTPLVSSPDELILARGDLVIHRALGNDVDALFEAMLDWRFPVQGVIPIARCGWDDEIAMKLNWSTGFNYRPIAGTQRPSKHALGLAFDLNPALNPCFKHRDSADRVPVGAVYDPDRPGTLSPESLPVQFLVERGWVWGGNWDDPANRAPREEDRGPWDLHHFQKVPEGFDFPSELPF